MKLQKRNYATIVLFLLGAYLVLDSLFLHWLYFIYPPNLKWLDPIISHWIWGIILVVIAMISWRGKK